MGVNRKHKIDSDHLSRRHALAVAPETTRTPAIPSDRVIDAIHQTNWVDRTARSPKNRKSSKDSTEKRQTCRKRGRLTRFGSLTGVGGHTELVESKQTELVELNRMTEPSWLSTGKAADSDNPTSRQNQQSLGVVQ